MLPEGTQWILDGTERIQPGDLMRVRVDEHSAYGPWQSADHLGNTIVGLFTGWLSRDMQFCRPVQASPEQPPATTPDRGSKYHRTITQTIAGETHRCSIVVDVYDVLRAFGVSCPASQHAVKKLLCPGLRGAKTAEQDIEEAANSCRRAIELLEFDL